MTRPRRCRMCGTEIESRRIRYGRDTAPSDWWVHLATSRVPCDPADRRRHEQAMRDAGILTSLAPLAPLVPSDHIPELSNPHTPSHVPPLTLVPLVPVTPNSLDISGETEPDFGATNGASTVPAGTEDDLIDDFFA